jgi:hypothetical protein
MKINLISATIEQLPTIQNMARFYAYDLSKSCGQDTTHNWAFPETGLYEAPDFSKYFKPDCYPFLPGQYREK